MHPRLQSCACARPLNFTVRSQRVSASVITLGAIVTGIVLAALGYQVLEVWVLHRSSRSRPPGPVAGIDALVGTDAEVVEAFRRSGTAGPPLGRVRVGTETWQAELAGNSPRLAAAGDHVQVVGVSGLVLRVTCR